MSTLVFCQAKRKTSKFLDYLELNRITIRNTKPILRTDELFDRIQNAKVFSNLDMKGAFHRIPVYSEDIEETYFNLKYDQFKFFVMPTGFCKGLAAFQTQMNTTFLTVLTHS